ncbi:hypothetical protein Dimus_016402, partial [Dionaea muscipula]
EGEGQGPRIGGCNRPLTPSSDLMAKRGRPKRVLPKPSSVREHGDRGSGLRQQETITPQVDIQIDRALIDILVNQAESETLNGVAIQAGKELEQGNVRIYMHGYAAEN